MMKIIEHLQWEMARKKCVARKDIARNLQLDVANAKKHWTYSEVQNEASKVNYVTEIQELDDQYNVIIGEFSVRFCK